MSEYAAVLGKSRFSYREVSPFAGQYISILNGSLRRREKEEDERNFMNSVYASFSDRQFTARLGINSGVNVAYQKPAKANKEIIPAEIYIGAILESIKRDNRLLLNHHLYPSVSSAAYRNFVKESEGITSRELSALKNMVNLYASRNSKEVFKCEEIHLNEKTIKQLIDYYKMDSTAGNFLLSFHRKNEKSLAELISQAQNNLMRDKTWWN